MIEISPEAPFCDQPRQILVGRGDQQHPGETGLIVTEANEAAIIEETQQLYLGFRVSITDFIEEHHATAGLFNNAITISVCAGEGATFVAKEFRVGQLSAVGSDIGLGHRQLLG